MGINEHCELRLAEMSYVGDTDVKSIVTPEDVANRTEVLDVTHNVYWLEGARRKVSESYCRLAFPTLNPEEVYGDLCKDNYDNNGRTFTLASITRNTDGEYRISGTVRLVTGKPVDEEKGLAPLDAMNLIDVPVWPHVEEGLSIEQVGEFGRFVVADEFRTSTMKKEGAVANITKMLWEATKHVAEEKGIKMWVAIMPSYVLEVTDEAGIKTQNIPGMSLRWNNPEAEKIFKKYNIYWQKLDPRLYRFL